MAQTYEYVAICLFGLERLVGEEIEALGYEKTNVMDGRVTFRAGIDAMARANLWLQILRNCLTEQRHCPGRIGSGGKTVFPSKEMRCAHNCFPFRIVNAL